MTVDADLSREALYLLDRMRQAMAGSLPMALYIRPKYLCAAAEIVSAELALVKADANGALFLVPVPTHAAGEEADVE